MPARWEMIKDLPEIRRSLFGAVTFNNRMYIACGVRGSTRFGDVWSSADGYNWTQAAPDTTILPRRDSCAMVVHDNHMWILGGWDGTNYLQDVWKSADGTIWERVDHSQTTYNVRDDHFAWSLDNRLMVAGGDIGGAGSVLSCVHASYGGDQPWRRILASHGYTDRTDGCSMVFDNKAWMVCGINNAGTRQSSATYTADGINWYKTPDSCGLPSVASLGGCVYNEKMVVSGGYGLEYPPREGASAAGLGDVYYSHNGIVWKWGGEVCPNNPNWSRYNHKMLSLKNPHRCFILFGYDATAQDSSGEIWMTQDQLIDQCEGR